MPFLTCSPAFTRALPKKANLLDGEKRVCATQLSVQASRMMRNSALGQETLCSLARSTCRRGGIRRAPTLRACCPPALAATAGQGRAKRPQRVCPAPGLPGASQLTPHSPA